MADLKKLTVNELMAYGVAAPLAWAEIRRRLDRLEKCEALNKYAWHRGSCTRRAIDGSGKHVCECGYDAARAALEE